MYSVHTQLTKVCLLLVWTALLLLPLFLDKFLFLEQELWKIFMGFFPPCPVSQSVSAIFSLNICILWHELILMHLVIFLCAENWDLHTELQKNLDRQQVRSLHKKWLKLLPTESWNNSWHTLPFSSYSSVWWDAETSQCWGLDPTWVSLLPLLWVDVRCLVEVPHVLPTAVFPTCPKGEVGTKTSCARWSFVLCQSEMWRF